MPTTSAVQGADIDVLAKQLGIAHTPLTAAERSELYGHLVAEQTSTAIAKAASGAGPLTDALTALTKQMVSDALQSAQESADLLKSNAALQAAIVAIGAGSQP